MKIEIRNRFNNSILFEGEFDNFRSAAEAAVRAGTNLINANLTDANLTGADLRGVNLTGVIGYHTKPKVKVVSRIEDPYLRKLEPDL